MRVETYELVPWISGQTSAGLNEIPCNKLILNGICISDIVPDVLGIDNLIQIDICGECFQTGCTTNGYVQVFEKENIAKALFPLAPSSFFNISRIEEEIVGFYSVDFTAERSKDIYLSAKSKLLTTKSSNISITELTETPVKIVAMLDTNPYKEWDCVYLDNGVELFPVGDNLAIRLG